MFVVISNSCSEEGYCCTGIYPYLISGVEGLGQYIIEHFIFFRTNILTVLVNILELLWCGTGLDPMQYWLCLIEYRYDFIDVIYHSDLTVPPSV